MFYSRCVFVTSWVVHMHEEHIFVSIQDGVELQTHTHTLRERESRCGQIIKIVMTNLIFAINLI